MSILNTPLFLTVTVAHMKLYHRSGQPLSIAIKVPLMTMTIILVGCWYTARSLGLQIAQSSTLGPKIDVIHILGALRYVGDVGDLQHMLFGR